MWEQLGASNHFTLHTERLPQTPSGQKAIFCLHDHTEDNKLSLSELLSQHLLFHSKEMPEAGQCLCPLTHPPHPLAQ